MNNNDMIKLRLLSNLENVNTSVDFSNADHLLVKLQSVDFNTTILIEVYKNSHTSNRNSISEGKCFIILPPLAPRNTCLFLNIQNHDLSDHDLMTLSIKIQEKMGGINVYPNRCISVDNNLSTFINHNGDKFTLSVDPITGDIDVEPYDTHTN